MSLLEDAFTDLYDPKYLENYQLELKYNNRFKAYNANVRLHNDSLTFNLSKKWRFVSREIQIGLVQELMLKIFKKRLKSKTTKTINIDMYSIFMQKIHIAVPKTKTDTILEQSFDRVNEKYFNGLVEKPNLVWNDSIRKLGSYEFGSDIITISLMLKDHQDILDYVMYHEMLHKKYKFKRRKVKSVHHSGIFKRKEAEFENSAEIEAKITRLVRTKRNKRFFNSFFS